MSLDSAGQHRGTEVGDIAGRQKKLHTAWFLGVAEPDTKIRLRVQLEGHGGCDTRCIAASVEFSRSVINNLTYRIIAAVIEVHRHLGPGLLESVYQRCLRRELDRAGVAFHQNRTVDVVYKGETIDSGLKLDLLVEGLVVVELKSVQELAPVHEAQVLSYLKLTGAPVGLLVNFNVPNVSKGIRRLLNKDHQLVDRFDPCRGPGTDS